jgi:excisionase family DNA binding protein
MTTTTTIPNWPWKITEIADYLGVPVDTMRYWRAMGEGPICRRIGKHLRYRVGDVLAWVEERRGM